MQSILAGIKALFITTALLVVAGLAFLLLTVLPIILSVLACIALVFAIAFEANKKDPKNKNPR